MYPPTPVTFTALKSWSHSDMYLRYLLLAEKLSVESSVVRVSSLASSAM